MTSVDIRLAEYFFEKSLNPKCTKEDARKSAIRLLESYPAGLLFFAVRWARKYYPYSFTSLDFLDEHIEVIQIRYEVLGAKKRWERRRAEYDPKNRIETKNPPDWIRKGVDYNLFK